MSLKVYVFLVFTLTATSFASPVENVSQTKQEVTGNVAQEVAAAASSAAETVASATPIQTQQEPVASDDKTRSGRSYSPKENDIPRAPSQVEESVLRKLNAKCAQRDPSSCAMLKLITYMNRLFKKANIDISDNIEITQTTTVTEVKAEDLPRSISEASDEAQTAELLTAKFLSFVRSRALRLRLVPNLEAVITSNPDSNGNLNLGFSLNPVSETAEGRGKNKNMGGIMAMMMMKAGMMGALALKGLVLLVGKALIVAKIALLLAVIIGLKKLFHHEKHVTYEVVAQPHHTHSHIEHIEHGHGGGGGHDSYSSGWGRSADVGKKDAHNLAYRAYIPKH
ncbi:hypothetical protein RUM44_001764 [Polyplax serrata]|uniref:Uncharacterized protein n=1 Tax=Polyplax serrata TaxID=468196 RepID=A0ABR1AKZ0_POLSC